MRMSRFDFSRYSTRSLATFFPVSSASSARPFSMSSSVTLNSFFLRDRGHQEAGADLPLGVGVDRARGALVPAPA